MRAIGRYDQLRAEIRRRHLGLAAAALAAAAVLPPAGAWAQTYGMATMPAGTLSFATGAAIAKVMQQMSGMQTRVQPSSGESVLLPLVNNGEADLGIANILEVIEAHEGKAVAGKQDKLRIAAVIHQLRVGYFVRKDSGIRTVADLKGKRCALGYSAMGTINRFALAVLATGGLAESDVKPVLVPNVVRGADDLASGAADAFIFAIGGAKVNEVDASVGGLRLVPVSDRPEAVAAAQKLFPHSYVTVVNPRPGLTGVPESTNVLTYDNILATGASVKDEVVYKVVDTLVKHKADLVAAAPQLSDLSTDGMYKKFPVPYHPGAVKWFQEKGIQPK